MHDSYTIDVANAFNSMHFLHILGHCERRAFSPGGRDTKPGSGHLLSSADPRKWFPGICVCIQANRSEFGNLFQSFLCSTLITLQKMKVVRLPLHIYTPSFPRLPLHTPLASLASHQVLPCLQSRGAPYSLWLVRSGNTTSDQGLFDLTHHHASVIRSSRVVSARYLASSDWQ